MQCCVPFCANTSDNASTSEGTGITFHKLPSDKHLHAAWLRALGIQDHHLPDPAVVCSQHLLDKDFYKAESVRHIHINAIPSTVQMCMICLHTDSKLSLMSKLKMEEAYKQLTGLSLCRGGSLQQTLCVLCAQRLINFSRFRDLSLRAHSLMTDLLEQRESITVQHMETLYYATKHLQCNLSQTTLGADHCDLYIDHTDEEEQTAAEESVVGDVAVVKNEYSTDFTSNADDSKLVHKDNDIDMSNSVSDDKYSDMRIKLEPRQVDEAIDALETEHMSRKEICIKTENVVFGCTLCFEDFVQENVYKEHMIMHLQNTACDASQVCESSAAGSCCDSLVLDNKTERQWLHDDPYPAADCDQDLDDPLAANNDNKVQATEEEANWKSEQNILKTKIGALDKHLSQNNIKTLCREEPNKTLLVERTCVRTHTGAKPYSTETFHYKTANKSNSLKHKRTDTTEKLYSCETCSYKTANKCNLLRHNRTHTGEKPYGCEVCNFKCAQKSNLLYHMKTHSGEKPYSCEICDFKSAYKNKLLIHNRIHTGEKPYSCEICNYKTTVKGNLLRHKRIHTDEKPYCCKMCDYKSANKTHLLIHKRTHTGEKPFSCEKCNYKCAHKHHLSCHMKTHTGKKLFSCEICNYKTLVKRNLNKHKRTHTVQMPTS